ncbi:MAG TPA: PqqD family protein, partial [Gemmataceae bacterium]|nr:PqqD family protein [Gemmataceae bacterium]
MLPLRREAELLIQEMDKETFVYDQRHQKAPCLNPAAALVWRNCDGRTSVAELARLLHEPLGVPTNKELVWHALYGWRGRGYSRNRCFCPDRILGCLG